MENIIKVECRACGWTSTDAAVIKRMENDDCPACGDGGIMFYDEVRDA